jgi:hypothetical protein
MGAPRYNRLSVSRAVTTFIPGVGAVKTPVSTSASQASTSTQANNPARIYLLGLDQNSQTVTLPSMGSGSLATVTLSIPLPRLATYSAYLPASTITRVNSIATKTRDVLLFTVQIMINRPGTNGVYLTSASAVPKASVGTAMYSGPQLPSGFTYSGFSAYATLVFNPNFAYGGGEVVTVVATGQLAIQPS